MEFEEWWDRIKNMTPAELTAYQAGRQDERMRTLMSRFLCWIGSHDWRDGPGFQCVECGCPDDFPWEDGEETC